MPTYSNTNDSESWGSGPLQRFAPLTDTVTLAYVKSLPAGVTLKNHEPLVQPWQLLATVTAETSDEISTRGWSEILILNDTDRAIKIAVNSDAANAFVVLPGARERFCNKNGVLGSLQILDNTSQGPVYVYANKKGVFKL